jgi:SnoaL-like domain
MKLTKQLKAEITDMYEAFWGALFYADIDMYSLFLDEDYRLIGTTEQEFFFSKAEAVRFLQATADQLAGNLERRNSRHKIEIIDNLVFITDQFDAYVLIDDKWSFYEKTRVTTLIQEKKNGWKIMQQHFSFPDNKAGSGQTIGLEKIAKENLQLKEAIRRRTIELELKNKELEIEFSLERVRAVAMGMKQPADMLEVCEVIARELISLGVGPIRNIQTAVIDTEKETYQNYEYYQVAREKLVTTVSYKEHPIVHAFVKRMVKDPEGFYARRMKGEGLKKWIKYQAKAGQFVDPTSTKAASLHYYFYSIGSGALGITTYAPLSKEAIALFKRFRNVFQLAYARFIDIQQAVAQAREAQIELALERVRAGAMAMRQSDELGQLIFVLYQELTKLDAKLDRCFIMIVHPENQGITWWMAGQEGLLAENGFFIQTNQHASHLWYLDCWKKRKKKWQYLLEGKEKRDWDRFGFTKTELTRLPEPVKKFMAGVKKIQLSGSSDQFGSLVTGSFEPLPEEHQEIINRFAVAFNQAYIRFLDLQKAEDQAREAQIQLAMERVRARTMAMQGSNELPVAANLLFQQVQSLGMPAWSAGYCIWDEKKQGVTLWMSSEGVMQPAFHAPLTKDPSFIHMREAFEKGRDFHVEEVGGKALVAHYKYMRTLPVVGEVLDSIIAAGHPLPVYQIFHCVYFSHGFLLFITYEPVPEAHVIFKRFGTVFDQTYTRFLDLQKAEAQTREAQIEASLERVRSRAMAMHSSAELTEVALELRKQMGRIGQKDLEVCAIHLYDDEHSFESWSAMKVPGSASEILQTQARFPKKGIRIVDELMKKYRAGEKDYVIVNAGAKSVEWFSVLKEYAPELHASIIEAIGDMPLKRLKSNWSVADFSGGALVMVTYGEPNPISRNLLRRSANVFEQAYIRFLDLRKAEAQAREAKIEAALERVRSRSMAMHKSEELADLSLELVKQVQALGVATWFCAFNIYDDEKGSVEWGSNGQGTFPKYRTPREGVFLRYFEAGQKGESLLINEIGKEECPAHYEYLCTLPGVGDQLLSMKRAGIPFPDAQIDHVAFFRYGYIIYITYAPAPESHEIFIRFAKVFEQTYTRFLDLQKSEAQAREAKIEAALERVRSRSLAMHHSSELSAVVDTLLREFTNLEFTLTFCIINLINEDDKSNTVWAANPEEGKDPESYYMKFEDYPFHHAMWKAWKAQDKRFVYTIEGEEKRIYDQYLYTDTEFSRFPENVKQANRALERYVAGFTFFRYSGLQTVSVNAITEAELEILERFGRVFEQSYTRFLDLQKAEAQAREAQIEAALERVRSRSMAMHKSDELLEAGEILFLEMQKLGIESLTAGYVLMDKGEKNGLNYTPHPGTKKIMPAPVIIPHNETIHMQQVVENWKKGKSFFIVEMDEEETITTDCNFPYQVISS